MSVIAVDSKGRKQEFSDLAWRMIQNNPNGRWKLAAEQKSENTIASKTKPRVTLPTGEAPAQTVDNTVKTDSDQKTDNTVNPADDDKNQDAVKTTKAPKYTEAEKAEFLEAIKGLNRAAIKEFLERPLINVPYDKRATLEELQTLMGEALKYNLEAFQKSFE